MPVSKEWLEAVTKLSENKTERRFLNDSADHAKVLIDLMIGKSQEQDDVMIYCGELKPSCFGDALQSAKGHIRIVLDDQKGFSVIRTLPQEVQNRIQAKLLNEKDGSHFFVAGTAMRYELSHDEATAVANFNEPPSELEKLKVRFNKLWENAICG